MKKGIENTSMNDIAKASGYVLVEYQEEYPFYFQMLLETIRIDFETTNFLPEEKETFLIGEQINDLLSDFLKSGIDKGDFRSDIEIFFA